METVEDNIPSGAGKTWLYVEPDGDVLPAQGMADNVLGNFLRDPWETDLSIRIIRQHFQVLLTSSQTMD